MHCARTLSRAKKKVSKRFQFYYYSLFCFSTVEVISQCLIQSYEFRLNAYFFAILIRHNEDDINNEARNLKLYIYSTVDIPILYSTVDISDFVLELHVASKE